MRQRDDDAVADVLGNILMVAITVTMMVGLSMLVLSFDGPPDKIHADFRVDLTPGGSFWGDGNEEIHIRHIGGEPVPTDGTRIIIAVNGVSSVYAGAALDQGFADGTFRLGETWNQTLTVPGNASVEVGIVQTGANQIIASNYLSADLSLAKTGNITLTYIATANAIKGTISDLHHAQSGSDGGASAIIDEASIAGGSKTTRLGPGAVNNAVGVTGSTLVLASDDARTVFKETGHQVTVDSFATPAGLATISSVKIGFEGLNAGGGGPNGDPQVRLSYSGVPLAVGSTRTVTLATATDAGYTLDITADKATWTASDVQAIKVKVERLTADAVARDAGVDHMFVDITYNEVPTTDAEVRLDFAGVPSGVHHELQIRYSRSGDTFAVQVHNGAAWVQRGTLTSSTMSLFTYTLAPADYKAGSPQIRIVDLDSGATSGTLQLDYVRIQTA